MGLAKASSSYDYRVTRRGGKGIELMSLDEGAEVVGAFPISDNDGLVLVTNGGQLIRCPVDEIRIARRSTRGVRIFDVANGDRVVSVSPLREQDEVSSSDPLEGSEVTE